MYLRKYKQKLVSLKVVHTGCVALRCRAAPQRNASGVNEPYIAICFYLHIGLIKFVALGFHNEPDGILFTLYLLSRLSTTCQIQLQHN